MQSLPATRDLLPRDWFKRVQREAAEALQRTNFNPIYIPLEGLR